MSNNTFESVAALIYRPALPSDLTNGTNNPYAALRMLASIELAPVLPESVTYSLYAFIVLFAIMSTLCAIGLFVRKRNGQLWFWRTQAFSTGSLVLLNPVNTHALSAMIYTIISQAFIVAYIIGLNGARDYNPTNWTRAYLGHLTFSLLFISVCADLGGSMTGILASRHRNGEHVPRWLPAWFVHSFVFGLPIGFTVGMLALYGNIAYMIHLMLDAWRAVDHQLAEYAAQWPAGSQDEQLAVLQGLGAELHHQTDRTVTGFTVIYALITFAIALLWLLWIPTNYFQIKLLRRQIFHLRQTVVHEKAMRTEKRPPRWSDSSSETSDKRGTSPMRFQRAVMRPKRQSISQLEKQAHHLLAICHLRIASAVGLTALVTVFCFTAAWVAAAPLQVILDHTKATFIIVAPFSTVTAIFLPVLALFCLRSFDKESLATTPPPNKPLITSKSSKAPLMIHVDVESAIAVDVDDEEKEVPKRFEVVAV